MSGVDQFLQLFLNQEVQNLKIENEETAKTLLALIGLERIKNKNSQSLNEIDLKKIASDFIKSQSLKEIDENYYRQKQQKQLLVQSIQERQQNLPGWWHQNIADNFSNDEITPKITQKVAENCFKNKKDQGPYTNSEVKVQEQTNGDQMQFKKEKNIL